MAINKSRVPFEDMGEMETPTKASNGKGAGKFVAILLTAVIAIIVIGAICWGIKAMWIGDSIAKVSGKEWQAVFLSNGQVYFGKVKAVGMKSVTLTDIYYLQVVTKPLQSTATGSAAAAANSQTQQELTLIKLGNEIHGPTDAMVINRDQILLTEKLKADSRVVQAIAKYIDDQKKK